MRPSIARCNPAEFNGSPRAGVMRQGLWVNPNVIEYLPDIGAVGDARNQAHLVPQCGHSSGNTSPIPAISTAK